MQRLGQKKLFLFDIDGTLSVGDTLYEGSADLLAYIDRIGGRSYYITNNSTRSGADYVDKFKRAFGLDTTEDQFVTAGYMTMRYLKENYAGKKIYVMGTSSYVSELRRTGLTVTTKAEPGIACVVVAYDSELTYEKLSATCEVLLTQDVPFYATNSDLRCPIDFGFIPDCGSICNMIAQTTDKSPVYLGKPSPEIVSLCLSLSDFAKEETLVVGDRLYTDIACGVNAGVDTCVLFTGEAKPEDLLPDVNGACTPWMPTYAFDTVRQLYDAVASC
ncbi:MAG: HAD-IIA family hydrolase [Lachnospiraceae bacterium]|nr:HAD-IIA family hydrolase [Lachnospiraceae bacterium]